MEDAITDAQKIRPTRQIDRPLLGLTILLVEDSRYFSDAVRLMAIRSGARLRRADCLHSARKHIRIYRPDAVLVDLGLPDGSGAEFIREISNATGGPPVIAMSGEMNPAGQQHALGAGASLYLQKPFYDLSSFQQTVLSVLPPEQGPKSFRPRVVGDTVHPDEASLAEDLHNIQGIMREAMPESDPHRLSYCAQFLTSVAQVSGDLDLATEAENLRVALSLGAKWQNRCAKVLEMLEQRLAA
ncbi:response regulator [Amylibacter marinus]|uniref:Response regulator n=1 Tax=Amylibacter marinus TaxID=1475483 RepID=A0ABQ5VUR9_9RHOB|nr:response regulator [Amylibacter marinus]GLQ34926.1 response regulator [Amylibacter marinus]